MNRPGNSGDRFVCVLCREWHGLKLGIVGAFGLCGRDVSDRLKKAACVEPVDPMQGGKFDILDTAPRVAAMDHFGLVEAVDRLGERVVVGISDASDGRFDACLARRSV